MKSQLRCTVAGRVQGVGFRYATRETARRLGLVGRVCNLADGRVEVVAEGDAVRLEQLLTWLHRGPPGARVDTVTNEYGMAQGLYTSFEITR